MQGYEEFRGVGFASKGWLLQTPQQIKRAVPSLTVLRVSCIYVILEVVPVSSLSLHLPLIIAFPLYLFISSTYTIPFLLPMDISQEEILSILTPHLLQASEGVKREFLESYAHNLFPLLGTSVDQTHWWTQYGVTRVTL